MILILSFLWLEKERKKQFKSQPSPGFENFHFFPTLSTIPTPATISFWYFFQPPYYSTSPSIKDLRVVSSIWEKN